MSQLIEQESSHRNKPTTGANGSPITRIKSQDLFRQMRELEIDHCGRIYKLRLTQLNKLILTA